MTTTHSSTHSTTHSSAISFWNREHGREETEAVYGEKWVRWLYGTRSGRTLADQILSRKLISKVYGAYQSSAMSRSKIEPFIRDFKIDMKEYHEGPFGSFNDFFIRQFKPGMRKFVADSNQMPAFSEARYLAWDKVLPDQTFPVKGASLTPSMLMGSEEKASEFTGGSLMIARLCPTDYHRYHYPDDGKTVEQYTISGKLHSVNPMALKCRSEIFITNERQVSILETSNFGRLAYIEVGALCVGKIVQSHPSDRPFTRGDEKGYFLFGGSTVIVLGKPGLWKPSQDLLEQTRQRRETYIKLGDEVARRT